MRASQIRCNKTNLKAFTFVSIAILSLITAGCEKPSDRRHLQFSTEPLIRAHFEDSILATGRLQALSSLKVSSQLSGRIDQVLVDYNDTINAEQVLAILDQQRFLSRIDELKAAHAIAEAEVLSADAAIRGAKAQLEELQKSNKRKLALAKKGNISQHDLEKSNSLLRQSESGLQVVTARKSVREAALLAAKAALKQAEIDLDRTIIRSPIDGTVIKRSIEPGQTVAARLEAPELFVIAQNLDDIEVYAHVDEADIGKIKQEQAAQFKVDAYPAKTFQGVVRQIRKSPQISQNIVTYSVIISAKNPNQQLLPGMTALVEINNIQKEDALLIPNAALRFKMPANHRSLQPKVLEENQTRVWLQKNADTYVDLAILVGHSNSRYTEVLSDNIKAGQHVVVGYRQ